MSAPLLMVLSTLLFATMGVCVKLAATQYSTPEMVFWRGLIGSGRNSSGVAVTPDTALAIPVLQNCVTLLAESIAQLPLELYLADGRAVVQLAFGAILYPGLFLGLTVLAVNLIGDGLRDLLDPRIAKKL